MKTSFWTRIFDLVAPRTCCVCGRRLSAGESVICCSCHLHLPLTHFERDFHTNEMAQRFWGLIPLERAAALFYYEAQSDMARLIYDLKYHYRPELGEHLGRIAARQFAAAGFFQGVDAIIPTPLSRRRQWQRGYNQSMEIARGVSSVTQLPIDNKAVRRVSFHQSQTHLSRWQRQANIDSAFRLVDARRISNRHLLLIDDIVTTGSTLVALAQELQKAGNVRFSILSLGYTKS